MQTYSIQALGNQMLIDYNSICNWFVIACILVNQLLFDLLGLGFAYWEINCHLIHE